MSADYPLDSSLDILRRHVRLRAQHASNVLQRDACFPKSLRLGGVLLAQEAQEEVLRADEVLPEIVGFLDGSLQGEYDAGGEWDLLARPNGAGHQFFALHQLGRKRKTTPGVLFQ